MSQSKPGSPGGIVLFVRGPFWLGWGRRGCRRPFWVASLDTETRPASCCCCFGHAYSCRASQANLRQCWGAEAGVERSLGWLKSSSGAGPGPRRERCGSMPVHSTVSELSDWGVGCSDASPLSWEACLALGTEGRPQLAQSEASLPMALSGCRAFQLPGQGGMAAEGRGPASSSQGTVLEGCFSRLLPAGPPALGSSGASGSPSGGSVSQCCLLPIAFHLNANFDFFPLWSKRIVHIATRVMIIIYPGPFRQLLLVQEECLSFCSQRRVPSEGQEAHQGLAVSQRGRCRERARAAAGAAPGAGGCQSHWLLRHEVHPVAGEPRAGRTGSPLASCSVAAKGLPSPPGAPPPRGGIGQLSL